MKLSAVCMARRIDSLFSSGKPALRDGVRAFISSVPVREGGGITLREQTD